MTLKGRRRHCPGGHTAPSTGCGTQVWTGCPSWSFAIRTGALLPLSLRQDPFIVALTPDPDPGGSLLVLKGRRDRYPDTYSTPGSGRGTHTQRGCPTWGFTVPTGAPFPFNSVKLFFPRYQSGPRRLPPGSEGTSGTRSGRPKYHRDRKWLQSTERGIPVGYRSSYGDPLPLQLR